VRAPRQRISKGEEKSDCVDFEERVTIRCKKDCVTREAEQDRARHSVASSSEKERGEGERRAINGGEQGAR